MAIQGIFILLYLQITWNLKLVHSVTEILSIYPLIWNLQFELETVFFHWSPAMVSGKAVPVWAFS